MTTALPSAPFTLSHAERERLVHWAVFDMSRDIKRAEAMGFVFGRPELVDDPNNFGLLVRGTFSCICGRREQYSFAIASFDFQRSAAELAQVLDVGRMLRNAGSFSRKHLLTDGYTEAQVDDMLAKADAFDKAKPTDESDWLRSGGKAER
jgi:hypothetical protein